MKKKASLSRLAAWYDKVSAFNIESLFSRKREPGPKRTILVNQSLPEDYVDHKGRVKPEHVYISNQVITSKYTIFTFLPRNILEQFRRVANVFFLAIAILQFFDKFSTVSPGLVILPLLVILLLTAVKDGYEDLKRHQSDRRVNQNLVRALVGGDWQNENAMKPKDRTFVRRIISGNLRRKQAKTSADPEKAEALGGEKPPNPDLVDPPDVEFDEEDGTPEEHAPGAAHHFWQREDRVTQPHWKKTMWEDVRVGDIVKIVDNEPIPADILICATSEDENVAFVETKNLDGETNLKSRMAVSSLTHLRTAKECANKRNVFRIDCDRPDNNMFKLNATVKVEKEQAPVDIQTTLLRGTVLRNTRWVIGVVLFTGEDTKIVMNSGGTPSKRSKVERQMNPQVFINLAILACMAVACAIVDSILEHRDYPRDAPWLYGDNQSDDNPSINGLVTWAFALITFQNIVPISLYVSMEFIRTCQALFIYFDYDMWYEKTDQATLARSWNLSDDLGQVEYIFSDKTGTLTQNSMVFRGCSVGGKIYENDDPSVPTSTKGSADLLNAPIAENARASSAQQSTNPSTSEATRASPPPPAEEHFRSSALAQDLSEALSPSGSNATHARHLNGFFTVLALCHTVLTSVDPDTGKIQYKAQSPDEAALVQAAADVGYVFKGKDRDVLTLQKPGQDKEEKYDLLNILEFNSARKRMSIVLRKLDDENGRLFLLTKGADNVIFERLRKDKDEALKDITEEHLSQFASEGLRTLTLAYKIINEQDYAAWSERYHEATVSLENREERIDAVSDELEQDLRLLGATAIEDSLQDGVPETIEDLKRAGIKVWVATGDKLETAIAIGHSTNLIGKDSNIIIIRGGARPVYQQMINAIEEFFPETNLTEEEYANASAFDGEGRPSLQRTTTGISSVVGSNNGERPGGFVLVIDGVALTGALGDEEHKDFLLKLAMLCEGVICCRVSPLQKALVVKLVKEGLGTMTLAIGDGANDVSMIQAADVGVGISGEEGLQAVNASDYAIAQFRFLKRLLLVHGHWSYARNGNLIVNFFYKNIICIGVLWWYQIYCGWSSTYAFEYTYLLWWNAFWTIAPAIAMGVFDRLADADLLMAFPELYRYGRESSWFGLGIFSIYMIDGIVQSAIIYFILTYGYFSPTSRSDGYDQYLYEYSTTMAISAVMVANLFNGLNTNVWTGWVFFAVFLGIVLIWGYTAIYSIISPGWFVTPVYGNHIYLFRSALFWLSLPIAVLLSLMPRYIAKAYKFNFAPDDIDILRWMRKVDPKLDLVNGARLSMADERLRQMRRHGSAVSQSTVSLPASARRSSSHPQLQPNPNASRVSRTDMATGIRSVHRGFDFATEEGGVAMRRIQTNLSSRRNLELRRAREDKKHHHRPSHFFRSLRGKKHRLASPETS